MENRSVLPDSLRKAASTVIDLAEKHGIGPELPDDQYEVTWMQPTDESRSTGVREERTEPSFQRLSWTLRSELTAAPKIQELTAKMNEIAKESEIHAVGLAGMVGEYSGEQLLRAYFDRVKVLRLDEGSISQVCRDYLEDIQATTVPVATFFLVENFNATNAFQLSDEIEFRPVAMDDVDSFGREHISFFPRFRPVLNLKDWICEVHSVGGKDTFDGINRHHYLGDEIATALNLTKQGRALFTLLANYYESPFYGAGMMSGGQATPTSRIGGTITLDPSDIKAFASTFQAVQNIMAGTKQNDLRLPLRRLRASAWRRENEDTLVDYVIGLERLLAQDSPQLETTFRFRLRGASLLPESFGSPRERIKLMDSLYKIRSDVVHGRAKESEVGELLPQAENVLRTILLWYVHKKPTSWSISNVIQTLDDALVAGGSSWASQETGLSPS